MASEKLAGDVPTGYGTAAEQATIAAAMECLSKVKKVEVKEKASLLEAATALIGVEVEMANKYEIFSISEGGEPEQILYAMEETGFFKRQFKTCCPDCAPWHTKIIYTQGGKSELAFTMDRPCTFTCCCFNRPVVDIYEGSSQQKVGSIRDPFACCDLTFSLMDGDATEVMQAKGGCCQWGLCCPLPCGPCSTVTFDIATTKDENVGQMVKQVPSCLKWCFASDVDNYKLDLEGVSDSRSKLLLIALAVFVDFRYFNDNTSDN